jgi:predicted dehydrogenase
MPLPIALLGCGAWGRNILRDLLELDRQVVVVEPDPDAARAAVALGASLVVPAAPLLPAVVGAVVATPAATHVDVVLPVLAQGLPVLCEKPLASTLAGARQLAQAGSGRLFVGHVWHYHAGIRELARIAASGELGPVLWLRTVRTNWTSPRQDVDTAWNLAPHDLSIAQCILGGLPAPAFAVAEVSAGRCVSMIGVLRDATDLAAFVFEVSNRSHEKRREVRLHCRDGVAVLHSAQAEFIEVTRTAPDGSAFTVRRPLAGEAALKHELRAFCTYLDGGPPPPTTASHGLAVVEALVALRALAGLDPD